MRDKELIGVLNRSDASLHDKARACQQLGEFGTKDAVPALAALLADPVLAAYARSGLEGIPDPSAPAALRAALPNLKGLQLIGAVNSLGVLRDAESVPALAKLAGDPSSGAAKEALLSLGRISTRESLDILREALTKGPEALRDDAGAACVLAGLYDPVRTAPGVSAPVRLAATRGAILARKSEGIGLLVELLRSEDRETRNVALYTVRAMSGPNLAPALRKELGTAKPEVQAQLIIALADCGRDQESVRLIRSKAASESPEVREAVFKALGKIGDPADAKLLLKAAMDGHEAAAYGLARWPDAQVDSLILSSLKSAKNPAVRIALIDLIDARPPARAATGELLKLAADADVKVSRAALRPLRSLGAPDNVAALIGITKSCRDAAQRTAAEDALFYASTRTGLSTAAADQLLAELSQAREDADKASWMRVLSALSYAKALPAIAANLGSGNPLLSRAAAESLGKWTGPAPVNSLLEAVQTTSDSETRMRALTSVAGLAEAAIENRQAPDTDVLGWLQRAGSGARTAEERKVVLSVVDRMRDSSPALREELDRLKKALQS